MKTYYEVRVKVADVVYRKRYPMRCLPYHEMCENFTALVARESGEDARDIDYPSIDEVVEFDEEKVV